MNWIRADLHILWLKFLKTSVAMSSRAVPSVTASSAALKPPIMRIFARLLS